MNTIMSVNQNQKSFNSQEVPCVNYQLGDAYASSKGTSGMELPLGIMFGAAGVGAVEGTIAGFNLGNATGSTWGQIGGALLGGAMGFLATGLVAGKAMSKLFYFKANPEKLDKAKSLLYSILPGIPAGVACGAIGNYVGGPVLAGINFIGGTIISALSTMQKK